jgi:hypothetical protein
MPTTPPEDAPPPPVDVPPLEVPPVEVPALETLPPFVVPALELLPPAVLALPLPPFESMPALEPPLLASLALEKLVPHALAESAIAKPNPVHRTNTEAAKQVSLIARPLFMLYVGFDNRCLSPARNRAWSAARSLTIARSTAHRPLGSFPRAARSVARALEHGFLV